MVSVLVYNPQMIHRDPKEYSRRIWAAISAGKSAATSNIGVTYDPPIEEPPKGTPTLKIVVEDDEFGHGEDIAQALAQAFEIEVEVMKPGDTQSPKK